MSWGGKLQVLNRGGKEVEPFIGGSYSFQGAADEGNENGFSIREF